MSDFNEAFQEVIGLEGGYVFDPSDKGLETKWGIAKRWNPGVDIKNLTLEGAKQIYWKQYWNPLQLALVQDDAVATEIFEQAVNMGRKQAALHAQLALQLVDGPVVVDGYMGPATAAAINGLGQRLKLPYLKTLNGLQFKKYMEIVDADPSQKRFFVGWLKRINFNG